MKIRTYHVYFVDRNKAKSLTFGECEDTKEATMSRLRKWCEKCGHTLLEETYCESEMESNPEFVEACLGDIAGFKR